MRELPSWNNIPRGSPAVSRVYPVHLGENMYVNGDDGEMLAGVGIDGALRR